MITHEVKTQIEELEQQFPEKTFNELFVMACRKKQVILTGQNHKAIQQAIKKKQITTYTPRFTFEDYSCGR